MIWTPHATVATLIQQEGRFLCVEEHSADGTLVINQPAGHVEENESILDAAIRETYEETGWRVALDQFVGIYTYYAPNDITYYRFCFTAHTVELDESATLDDGIVRALWLSNKELHARKAQWRSPLLMQCIDDYLAGKRYPLDILYEHPNPAMSMETTQ